MSIYAHSPFKSCKLAKDSSPTLSFFLASIVFKLTLLVSCWNLTVSINQFSHHPALKSIPWFTTLTTSLEPVHHMSIKVQVSFLPLVKPELFYQSPSHFQTSLFFIIQCTRHFWQALRIFNLFPSRVLCDRAACLKWKYCQI